MSKRYQRAWNPGRGATSAPGTPAAALPARLEPRPRRYQRAWNPGRGATSAPGTPAAALPARLEPRPRRYQRAWNPGRGAGARLARRFRDMSPGQFRAALDEAAAAVRAVIGPAASSSSSVHAPTPPAIEPKPSERSE